jgi:transcriptional regulator with XRE-family HTH domain
MVSKKIIESFSSILKSLREEKNLTLKEVAVSIKIDTSLLGKLERNERKPTKNQIKLISIYFKYDEKKLIIAYLSDQFASKIFEEKIDDEIFKITKNKINYLKKS